MSKIKQAKQEIMKVLNKQSLPAEILQEILENINLQLEIATLHNNINMLNGELEEIKKEQEIIEEEEDSDDDG